MKKRKINGIHKIVLSVSKKDSDNDSFIQVEDVNKVDINISFQNDNKGEKNQYKDLKKYLSKYYEIEESNIYIN